MLNYFKGSLRTYSTNSDSLSARYSCIALFFCCGKKFVKLCVFFEQKAVLSLISTQLIIYDIEIIYSISTCKEFLKKKAAASARKVP